MVYVIHFEQPLGNDNHQAQHYVGTCAKRRLQERMDEHRAGSGARILAACNERGIRYRVVALIDGGRQVERRIKNTHNIRRLCPCCSPNYQPRTHKVKFIHS